MDFMDCIICAIFGMAFSTLITVCRIEVKLNKVVKAVEELKSGRSQ